MSERLVLCGGAKHGGGPSVLRLALGGRSQNISLKLEDISKRLVRNIPDVLSDLIEIASYVFCADQATSRGGKVQQGMGADWRRNFRFVIPVRNPSLWNRHNVAESLCATLSFLSDDNYAFEFEKASNPVPFPNYLEFGADVAFKADEVVLFSGGLDSLSGAIEELSTNRKHVALVSHRSSSKIFDHQKHLVAELKQRFRNQVIHVPVLATRQGPLRVQEYTQRTRSFLYAALACVVARLFEINRIRFFENGIVSINLPISEQVVGGRATRTTHPLVLKHFREFFSAAVGEPVVVENPFIWKSKADVVQSIVDRGCGGLIRHTISCTRTYDITKLHTHCGCCSQCLDRRFAILAANAAEHDSEDMYRVELLAGPRERSIDQTMAESYVRTALELREMGEFAFFGRFSGESARVCGGFPSLTADEVGRQVLDLHQRHGQLIGRVLETGIADHKAKFVNRSLPASSLLMMTIAPAGAPTLAPIETNADAITRWIDEADDESVSDDQRGGAYVAHQVPAGGPEQSIPSRSKSKPALERADGAIRELYPKGVPGQAAEPNANLCRRVGEKLKQAGLPGVSDDTILRAAGRRRK
jgi:7-cyano-7-deazaguanine synthase in queuosine biosynthesis